MAGPHHETLTKHSDGGWVTVHERRYGCYTAIRARVALLQHRYVQIAVHRVDPVLTPVERWEAGHVA